MSTGRKILCILVTLSVLLMLYSFFMREGIIHNRNYKPGYILSNRIDADIVYLGACEPEWGILPDTVKQYAGFTNFILGQFGADYAENFLTMRSYLTRQKNPRLVVIYATPESFDESIANGFNSYRFAHLVPDDTIRSVVRDFDPAYAQWSHLPFMRYAWYSSHTFFKGVLGWGDRITGKKFTPDNAGSAVFPIPFEPGKDAVIIHGAPAKDFQWSNRRAKYFSQLISFLQKQHIPVLLYESPLWEKGDSLRHNRNEMLAKIDSIAAVYQVPFKKFENKAISSDSTNFFTITNLSNKATGWFSKELGVYMRDSLQYLYPDEFK